MFTRDELITAAGTQPIGGLLPMRFAGGAIDSRLIQRGELFVALAGENTDGHRFIADAVCAGASAILCNRPSEEALAAGIPQLVVRSPLEVLQTLAQQHLCRQRTTRVIAVTGSNGKTSVKEAIAWLLQSMAPTLKTPGNLNTETGVPLTLLRLSPEHRFAVLEMGAQWVGEIARICRIAPPDIAVVTVVGPEHLEFFGSMENVALAEGEAVAALPSDGIAILNDDDRIVRRMIRRTAARVVTYGRRPTASVRAQRVAADRWSGLCYRFTLAFGGQYARVILNVPGAHAVTTALASASVALNCGMSVQAVAAGLGEIRPAKRRGEIKQGVNDTTLVDDSYNANRQSAEAAIRMLADAHLATGARRWFIFGDMLELGKYSPAEHAIVGRTAATAVDELVLVGTEVGATAVAAQEAGLRPEQIHLFPARLSDASELGNARLEAAAYTRNHLRPGDLLLVKGSLGVGMDCVVAELQKKPPGHRLQTDITTRLQQLTQEEAPLAAGVTSRVRLENEPADTTFSLDIGRIAGSSES
ncbi:MAG: UDP-N-acetylmuramoyl-tripeptide--D-alanyl-D-alanine ligase [Ktedonobacterales bacterium]